MNRSVHTLAPALMLLVVGTAACASSDDENSAPAKRAASSATTHDMSNMHPAVDDRGFSILENGEQHGHSFEQAMSPADRVLLGRELALARATAMQYPTLGDGVKAGLVRSGPFAVGLGTHMVMSANYAKRAGDGPITDDQIRHPLAWIYDGTKPDAPVTGLFYDSASSDPAGFTGPNDVWHVHRHTCTKFVNGAFETPIGSDNDRPTKAKCDAIGGTYNPAIGQFLHVWVVPGYEDSQGVFAHLNPAVTCNDGSYRIVDTSKIGYRKSNCVDGTE